MVEGEWQSLLPFSTKEMFLAQSTWPHGLRPKKRTIVGSPDRKGLGTGYTPCPMRLSDQDQWIRSSSFWRTVMRCK